MRIYAIFQMNLMKNRYQVNVFKKAILEMPFSRKQFFV